MAGEEVSQEELTRILTDDKVQQATDVAHRFWDEIDTDGNGTLSRQELEKSAKSGSEETEALDAILDDFDLVRGLNDKVGQESEEIEKEDLTLYSDLSFQTNLDRRYHENAKVLFTDYMDKIDFDKDGYISKDELKWFGRSYDRLNQEGKETVAYVLKRMNGDYSKSFKYYPGFIDQSKDSKEALYATDFYFPNIRRRGWKAENITSMAVADRVHRTAREMYSTEIVSRYSVGGAVVGAVAGGALGFWFAKKPLAMYAFLTLGMRGGAFGAEQIGKIHGRRYYGKNHRGQINRLAGLDTH